MAKKLKDFVVEINLDGWYNKGDKKSYRAGQKFKGPEISERMVMAIEGEESYIDKMSGKSHLVVELLGGGSASDLRSAFNDYEPDAPKIEPKPKVAEKKEEVKVEVVAKKAEEDKKPTRRARPS